MLWFRTESQGLPLEVMIMTKSCRESVSYIYSQLTSNIKITILHNLIKVEDHLSLVYLQVSIGQSAKNNFPL